ncbi:hypothetical protein R3P38DRAFT_3230947 [Favolaschia claudopus]|uniref:Uncharacterized protein n=1 Tax=Favolaschia claudopus TaxID=2862362 RepID=A0AAV9ZL56_9AGAR
MPISTSTLHSTLKTAGFYPHNDHEAKTFRQLQFGLGLCDCIPMDNPGINLLKKHRIYVLGPPLQVRRSQYWTRPTDVDTLRFACRPLPTNLSMVRQGEVQPRFGERKPGSGLFCIQAQGIDIDGLLSLISTPVLPHTTQTSFRICWSVLPLLRLRRLTTIQYKTFNPISSLFYISNDLAPASACMLLVVSASLALYPLTLIVFTFHASDAGIKAPTLSIRRHLHRSVAWCAGSAQSSSAVGVSQATGGRWDDEDEDDKGGKDGERERGKEEEDNYMRLRPRSDGFAGSDERSAGGDGAPSLNSNESALLPSMRILLPNRARSPLAPSRFQSSGASTSTSNIPTPLLASPSSRAPLDESPPSFIPPPHLTATPSGLLRGGDDDHDEHEVGRVGGKDGEGEREREKGIEGEGDDAAVNSRGGTNEAVEEIKHPFHCPVDVAHLRYRLPPWLATFIIISLLSAVARMLVSYLALVPPPARTPHPPSLRSPLSSTVFHLPACSCPVPSRSTSLPVPAARRHRPVVSPSQLGKAGGGGTGGRYRPMVVMKDSRRGADVDVGVGVGP